VRDATALVSQHDAHKEHPTLTVGTVKKSHATMALTWLAKNAFHVGDAGLC